MVGEEKNSSPAFSPTIWLPGEREREASADQGLREKKLERREGWGRSSPLESGHTSGL